MIQIQFTFNPLNFRQKKARKLLRANLNIKLIEGSLYEITLNMSRKDKTKKISIHRVLVNDNFTGEE